MIFSSVIIPLYGDFTNENNWYSICTGLILTILSALFANKILERLWMHLVLYLQSE